MIPGDLVRNSGGWFELFNEKVLKTFEEGFTDFNLDYGSGIFFRDNETGVILEVVSIRNDVKHTMCKILHESGVIGYAYAKYLRRVE